MRKCKKIRELKKEVEFLRTADQLNNTTNAKLREKIEELQSQLSRRNSEAIDLEDTIFDIVSGNMSIDHLNVKEIVAKHVVGVMKEDN